MIHLKNSLEETILLPDVEIDELVDESYSLVIHNDDVNTFQWVIKALVEICKHTPQQAEQCSLFIHYQGKYAVKSGSYNELKPLKEGITDRGINATIE